MKQLESQTLINMDVLQSYDTRTKIQALKKHKKFLSKMDMLAGQ